MEIKAPILHLHFPNRHLMASTLLRPGEWVGSPEFDGKVFTLEEYMDWYAKKFGSFTYFSDWEGFNLRSHDFLPFREGRFDPLSNKERALLSLLDDYAEPFSLIATHRGGISALPHEVVHGLYDWDEPYQKLVGLIIKKHLPIARIFFRWLKKEGYGKKNYYEETNAYCTTGWSSNMPADLARQMRPLANDLKALFLEHFGFDLRSKKHVRSLRDLVTNIPYEEFAKRL